MADHKQTDVPFPTTEPRPRNGTYRETFDDSDVTRVEGEFRDGLRSGSWQWYHPDGERKADYEYERGLKHGHELDWAENGTQICEGQNEQGVRSGTWTWWHDNGEYKQAYHYDDDGEKHGEYEWNLADGSPRARGEFWHGKRHGRWTWHQEPNHVKMTRGYQRGSNHGDADAWYTDDQIAYRRTWRYGKKHGVEETFHPDGSPKFRGEWVAGFPVGEHRTWNEQGNETVETFVAGLPVELAEDEKKLKRIARKIGKAKDSYKKDNVVRDAVDYGQRGPLLVHLWREGYYDVPADPDTWDTFANASGLLDGEDVITFLQTAIHDDAHGPHLPYWDRNLDRLVMEVYERDPDPIDAQYEELPEPNRKGVAFVRARWGKDVGDLLDDELDALLEKHVENYGLNDRILWPENGHVEEQNLYSDTLLGTPSDLFGRFLEIFTTTDEWIEGLKRKARAEIDAGGGRLSFKELRPLIAVAEPDLLAELIGEISLNNDTEDWIERALLEWRDDDGETLTRIALAIDDDGLRKWPALCCAVLKLDAEGNEVPEELIENFVLDAQSPTHSTSWISDPLRNLPDESLQYDPAFVADRIPLEVGCSTPRADLMHRALQKLPTEDVRSIIERYTESDYRKLFGIPFLYLVEDPELWRSFFELMEDDNYGHSEKYTWGLGDIGLAIVGLLEEALENAPNKDFELGYWQGIIVALARAADDGERVDAQYDRHIRFDQPSDNYKYKFFRPYLQRLVHRLPTERAEKILIEGLESSAFSRAFRFIASHPTPAVLETAFTELLEREAKFNAEEKQDVGYGLRGLPNSEEWVEWILRAGGGSGTKDTLKNVVGWKQFEELEERIAEEGVETAKELDHIDKVVLRAEEAGGSGERIYLLRRLDEDPEHDDLNVIGGLAPGFDEERWPTHDDEPMTHLYTLDLETMPELADRFDEYRTVSVFCHSPDFNEAWEAGTSQTAVIFSTEEQVSESVDAPDEAPEMSRAWFEAVGVDVDPAIWTERSDLHDEIYRVSARVGGEPIWLQGEDYWGNFLMQFDSSFVHMNLGDSGVMYTFADTAFWQCY